MRVWRLAKPEFAPGLDGEGARLGGGRWNAPGVPMVYCAASLALAVLEVMAHLPPAMRRAGALPAMVALGLDVPDAEVITFDAASLPLGSGISDCQAAGNAWSLAQGSLGLWVPSRVIPLESNLLLNPAHPAMAQVRVAVRQAFWFDETLGS